MSYFDENVDIRHLLQLYTYPSQSHVRGAFSANVVSLSSNTLDRLYFREKC